LDGWPRYFVQWHNTAQIHATQNQVTSLVCNGLFDRYPDLKVVFLESGVGWVTPFLWRFDQQYRELRSEIPWVKRLPSERIADHVRFATQPKGDVTASQFEELIEMGGTERLFMFSSDYPHYDADSPEVALPRTLPLALRRRIQYQNALETYPRLAGLAP
jgi:predicted TIM-barrel fold metal-dependent hydrolase